MRKRNLILLFAMSALLFTGCAKEQVVYESKRPKTANMEDQLILEMKQGMVEAATEAMEAATEAAQTEAPATEAPVTERAEVTEPAANAEFPYDVVLTGELNMRSGPADDYAVTYALTEGDQVRVIGRVTSESGAWYRVQYQGDSGYAYEESLDLVNGELGVE